MQKNKPDTIRIQTNEICAYLFALNQKRCLSNQEQQQIRAIERLIADNITRKDIPAYSSSRSWRSFSLSARFVRLWRANVS